MEIKTQSISEKKVRKYVDSLPKNEWVEFSVGKIAKDIKLAPTTVKWRLEILRVLGVIDVNTKYRKRPKMIRIK